MKKVIPMLAILLAVDLGAGALPWPHATSEALFLPFGLQWFQEKETANAMVVNYGKPDCGERMCRWMADTKEGTVILELSYHISSLIGVYLNYTLKKDEGAIYLEKLKKLKRSVSDWRVADLREFPDVSQAAGDHFKAETKDSRIVVKWREGEYSLFISLEMSAR